MSVSHADIPSQGPPDQVSQSTGSSAGISQRAQAALYAARWSAQMLEGELQPAEIMAASSARLARAAIARFVTRRGVAWGVCRSVRRAAFACRAVHSHEAVANPTAAEASAASAGASPSARSALCGRDIRVPRRRRLPLQTPQSVARAPAPRIAQPAIRDAARRICARHRLPRITPARPRFIDERQPSVLGSKSRASGSASTAARV